MIPVETVQSAGSNRATIKASQAAPRATVADILQAAAISSQTDNGGVFSYKEIGGKIEFTRVTCVSLPS